MSGDIQIVHAIGWTKQLTLFFILSEPFLDVAKKIQIPDTLKLLFTVTFAGYMDNRKLQGIGWRTYILHYKTVGCGKILKKMGWHKAFYFIWTLLCFKKGFTNINLLPINDFIDLGTLCFHHQI